MLFRRLAEVARGLTQLVFPNACLICDTPEGDRQDFSRGLCADCSRAIRTDPLPACPRCAATVGPHSDTTSGCTACRGASFRFDSAIRMGSYEGRLREAILRMKFAPGEGLAEQLGRVFCELAAGQLARTGIELVVPIPLHWRRRWSRGHNQAAALARGFAEGLGVKLDTRVLKRVRNTPQQLQPSATARRANVRGAFWAQPNARLSGRTVLLVDDVMTTGSTASEAAGVLLAAGVKRVVAAVVARR